MMRKGREEKAQCREEKEKNSTLQLSRVEKEEGGGCETFAFHHVKGTR